MLQKSAKSATERKTQKRHYVGAPSQLNQGNRKGKRAWRKNVDIADVELGLENIRAEERLTGSALQKKTDGDLFTIDVTGDDRVKRSLPRFSRSQLTSTKILAQRSGVPAVASRVVSSTKKRKASMVSRDDKARLLRIGKRHVRGPFNAVMDSTEFGAGSALLEITQAVKESGKYNVWGDHVQEGGSSKPSTDAHIRSLIEVPAVVEPHQGTSYNPPVSAHQELLRAAHEAEERRIKETKKHTEIREKIIQARQEEDEALDLAVPMGMILDRPEEAEETSENVDNNGEIRASRLKPERKTKQQRRKAEKQRAEKRTLADRLAKRRLHASVASAKSLFNSMSQSASARERARARKHLLLREKLKGGLAGQKFGKHMVKEGQIDVQLGEDLTESLRALKPEGNLFRDRFVSMQHRALVEPRAPILPKKTRIKFKETEKYAWKRFDQ